MGGAIFTNNEALVSIMKSIRIHGSGFDKYENVRVGINGRLDTLQAAILLEKLSIFDDELKSRNRVANYYSNNISSYFKKPFVLRITIPHGLNTPLLSKSESDRSRIMSDLSKEDIPSMIYYKLPLHLQTVMRNI